MTARAVGTEPTEARRAEVRLRYGGIATHGGGCCPTSQGSGGCCSSPVDRSTAASADATLGYSRRELDALPEGANLGLGCGNPTALTGLRAGQVVLDLGSGAGIDCFLAAKKVGPKGRVLGVDMTPEMVAKAREIARRGRYPNIEFRLGEIEHLPVADGSVDVVISNCVVNLVPEKGPVYREAFRVLRPGGHLLISDMVATRPISNRDRADPTLWSSCSSGALEVRELRRLLRDAGFRRIRVVVRRARGSALSPAGPATLGVAPADIRATRPAG